MRPATQDKFGGRIDILVNVAGGSGPIGKTGAQTTPEEFDEIVTLNMGGCFNTMHAVLPAMTRRGRGRLLLMGSGMGLRPQPLWSAYGVSKAASSRLMDSLAAALDGSGVTVLEISPGLVRTDMTESMWGPADEQPWNDVRPMVEAAVRFAAGDLDALHGRFVHAARDDLETLLARSDDIAREDARTLRLRTYAPDDPLA